MILSPPKDKFKLVFLVFVLHGIGVLMPWNMFITAKSYFVDFKLATNDTSPTSYAGYFLQYMGLASQIPSIIFNWINIFLRIGGDITKRIVYTISMILIIFIFTVILAMVDSSSWPDVFFWITMITIVILHSANGVFQNTVYGMAAILPLQYTGAIVLGSNLSGLLASIASICSSYFSSDRTAAIYYFLTAILICFICVDTYFALPLNKFYRYHEIIRRKEDLRKVEEIGTHIPYFTIFLTALPQLCNVFFTLFVTLAVFPAVHSDIKPYNKDFFIEGHYFISITCFLTFNLFAMLGSLTTTFVRWPNPKYLWILVLMRIIFVPLFLVCNYLPKGVKRKLPVLITNEWIYWIIAVIMSYSSGYLQSLRMMYAQTISPKYETTAGMFAAAMVTTETFIGILSSFLFPYFV
ncbi:LOW QUALITY PROTEIN: equilibrative nucleoside transporter 1-like [Glossina fuscipes fuscipes]